jgi:hypothetical protein
VADAKAPVVVVLNEDGKELGRFTVPSPATLYPVPGGQYVLTVHTEGNAVGFLWGGLRLEDHGDHSDVKEENPYVAATLRTGPKPRPRLRKPGVGGRPSRRGRNRGPL